MNNKGVTLIELVVAMSIALVVISTIGALYYSSITFYTQVRAYSRVQDNARIVMINLGKKIRYASGLIWEDGGRAVQIRLDPFYNSSTYPTNKPTIDTDDDVWIRYAWDGTSAITFDPDNDGPELPVLIACSIADFAVVAPSLRNNKGIEISVTVLDARSEKTITLEDSFDFRYM